MGDFFGINNDLRINPNSIPYTVKCNLKSGILLSKLPKEVVSYDLAFVSLCDLAFVILIRAWCTVIYSKKINHVVIAKDRVK